jgi:hypothetical protein
MLKHLRNRTLDRLDLAEHPLAFDLIYLNTNS